MNSLLLLLNESASAQGYDSSRIIRCVETSSLLIKGVEETVVLPGENISPLCRAILACANLDMASSILLTTQSISNGNLAIKGNEPKQGLIDNDSGWLFFPTLETFRQCAMDAIRVHDPQKGVPSLKNCWCQAILSGLVAG